MTGTQLFDRLSLDERCSSDPSAGERVLFRLAEQMVATSLTSGRMLRELRERMFPSDAEPESIALARTLRDEFQKWVQDAEAAYERARRLERAGQPIPGTGELGDLIGMTLAMLQITLEDHLRSLEQIASGQTVSMEELRRELQLKRGA